MRTLSIVALVALLCAPALAKGSARAALAAPRGYSAMEVAGVVPNDDGALMFLADPVRGVFVPIGIGRSEALSIHMRLEERRFPRPLTHDLLDAVVEKLGGRIVKVQIDSLHDGAFHGRVFVATKKGVISVDARASDAVALALGNHVPIFVHDDVVREAAVRPEDMLPAIEDEEGPRVLDL